MITSERGLGGRPDVSACDPEVLGRLCLLPSSFAALASAEELAALLEQELRTIPGIREASVSLVSTLDALALVPCPSRPSPTAAVETEPYRLLIRTQRDKPWGTVQLYLDDPARYQPYDLFIQALLSTLATELERRTNEKHLRLALESARLGTWSQELPHGRAYWDDRTREIFGVDADEPSTLERGLAIIHPEDQPRVLEAFQRAISPDHAGRYEVEKRIVRPDGTARWVVTTGQVLFRCDGEDRQPVAFSGLVADVTAQKEMEQELRESEARFRAMTDAAPMLVWMADTDKRCTYVNEPWLRFTGRTMAQELGDGWTEGIHPDDLDRRLETYAAAFDRREPFELEYRLRRHDGTYRWILDRGVPRIAPDDTFLGYIGSCFDIHDRKQAEEALRESQMMLRLVLDTIPQGVFWKDRHGRYLGANTIAARAGGFKDPSDLIGLTSHDLPGITPEQAAFFQAKDNEVMERGRPLLGIEEPRGHPDGSTSWLRTNKVPLRDTDGRIVGVLGTWEDVTERKKTEAALRDSEERLLFALDAAHAIAFEYDICTDEIHRAFGNQDIRLAEDFTGPGTFEQVVQAVHPDDRGTFRANVRAALASPTGAYQSEFRVVAPDGRTYWISERGRVEFDADRRPLRLTGLSQDITARKQAEEALRDLNETLEQRVEERTEQVRSLASKLTMAEQEERRRISQILHDDLQQRLSGIKMRLRCAQQDAEASRLKGLLAHIVEAKQWLDESIDITSELTVDLSPPILKSEGLADTLRWLVSRMKDLHGLEVHLVAVHAFRTPEEDMRVLLFQIVRELLFNVVKHAGTNQAMVEVCGRDNHVEIRVTDEGNGFDVPTAEAVHEGGFGLFSVRERLRLFDGNLTIDSAPGAGTRVIVDVPLRLE